MNAKEVHNAIVDAASKELADLTNVKALLSPLSHLLVSQVVLPILIVYLIVVFKVNVWTLLYVLILIPPNQLIFN